MRPFSVGVVGLSGVYFHSSCLGKIVLQLLMVVLKPRYSFLVTSRGTSSKLLLEMKS